MNQVENGAAYDAWVGRTDQGVESVSPNTLMAWCASLDFAGLDLGAMPLGLHWGLAHNLVPNQGLGADGHPEKGGFLPPIPLPRRMWAGGELRLLDDIRVGDVLTRSSRVAGISRKQGRSGTLWFVTVTHDWSTERGPLIAERQDIVYRDAGGAGAGGSDGGAPDASCDVELPLTLTPTHLFRFSALTFNSHRIHYDHPYATGVEGYPGLVVHGPLQACLLLNLARQTDGRRPSLFRFRGTAPLILGEGARLCARRADSGLELWVSDARGRPTMQAQAEWGTA